MSWPGSKAGNRTAGARFRLFPLLRRGSIAWSRHAFQKAYLASRAKDMLPEGTPIPERERAEAL
jgi:hypothetical protein